MSIENLNPERWGESAFSYEEEFGYEEIKEGDYDFSPARRIDRPGLIRPGRTPVRRPAPAAHAARPQAGAGYKRGTITFHVVASSGIAASSQLPAIPYFGTGLDLNTTAQSRAAVLVDGGVTAVGYTIMNPPVGGDVIRSANSSGQLDTFIPEQNPTIAFLHGLLSNRYAVRFKKVRFTVPSSLQTILDNAVFAIVSPNPLSAADINQQALGVSKSPQQFQPNIVDLEFAQPLTLLPHQFFVVKFGPTPVALTTGAQVATISFGVDADLEIVPI